MLSLMPLLTFFGVAYVGCLVRMLIAALEAPVGYEDEDGFHYGMETVPTEARS